MALSGCFRKRSRNQPGQGSLGFPNLDGTPQTIGQPAGITFQSSSALDKMAFSEVSGTSTVPTQQGVIGVFDSGVGGLSVMRELARQLPHEDILNFKLETRNPKLVSLTRCLVPQCDVALAITKLFGGRACGQIAC